MSSVKPATVNSIEPFREENHCAACRDALATAAHELKTPLAIMEGYLNLLLEQKLGPLTPQQLEVLSEMQDNGARLTSFVQNLLSYATLKVNRYEIQNEVADINGCLREIAEFWAQRFQDKAIAFYFFPDEKLPAFPFDWYKVQHVVSNLLDNAIKYTAAGGRVRLTVRREQDSAVLEVDDDGIGIPAEALPHVFKRFFRVDSSRSREQGGAGLGLAIVKSICSAHGAEIEVVSAVGKGSTFRLRQPLAGDAPLRA